MPLFQSKQLFLKATKNKGIVEMFVHRFLLSKCQSFANLDHHCWFCYSLLFGLYDYLKSLSGRDTFIRLRLSLHFTKFEFQYSGYLKVKQKTTIMKKYLLHRLLLGKLSMYLQSSDNITN